MTTAERVQAVADYGFTERQARFLVLVMRHAGMCIKRQYAAFAGIANGGEKCNAFFERLVRRGFAVAADCIHNRAQLYHIHSKLLYHAIGEPDSRYRRTVPARAAAERLMRLDAALMSPACDWLTTRSEKLAFVEARAAAAALGMPSDATIHHAVDVAGELPGTFPIGVDPGGHVVLLYLASVPWTDDFRTFLVGHAALLAVTPAWTLRLVFPQPLRGVLGAYQTVVEEELNPLSAETISELKRHFFHRRRRTDLNTLPDALRAFLQRCAAVYDGPRFRHLYRRWLTEQDAVFSPVPPTIREALTRGRAKVEYVVLAHDYEHLSPLVNRRSSRRGTLRKSDERGDETARAVNPSLNPAP
jgi:hypothetical protein